MAGRRCIDRASHAVTRLRPNQRSTRAETRFGVLSGVQKGRVIQWRGVPYAAPPIGPGRFRPPAPLAPWGGVRDASKFALAAPQSVSRLQGLIGGQPGGWSENCLYLNVFAPADAAGPLPVMVWIHGGAFIGGSGSARWYDGGRFAADGAVVVVTLNYRLGAFGFAQLEAVAGAGFESAGNCGLLDQLAALSWVRDNIAAFGGDPDQVTVFGESAGAMSIGTMLAMPAAEGLFHRAILQSGAASSYRMLDDADRVTARLLQAFGGSVGELLVAPAEKILAAQAVVTEGSDAGSYLAFRPVVDGRDLPEAPDVALGAGRSWALRAAIPVLVGTNRDEMTLFSQFDPGLAELSDARLERRTTAIVGAERWAALAPGYGEADAAQRWNAFTTDLIFRVPAIRLAESVAAAGGPVWMYRFDWRSPMAGGKLGATHALDIPFVWNLVDVPGVGLFTGTAPGRHELARAIHGAWLGFATDGQPAVADLPAWPPYRSPERATMIFDTRSRVVDDPNGAARRLWAGA